MGFNKCVKPFGPLAKCSKNLGKIYPSTLLILKTINNIVVEDNIKICSSCKIKLHKTKVKTISDENTDVDADVL